MLGGVILCGEKRLQLLAIQPFALFELLDREVTWRSRLYVRLGLLQVLISGDAFGHVGGNDRSPGGTTL